MAYALLYNFTDEVRRKKVRALLFRGGIPGREVSPEEQGIPLGVLLGTGEKTSEAERTEKPFREEMLVMHELTQRQFHFLLDGMKQQKVSVPLKAVTTPSNLDWSSARLYRELTAEHRAMTGDGGKPVHGEGASDA